MNLKLIHKDFLPDGIFGELTDGNLLFHTLEHAYYTENGDGSYAPKLQPGVYKCVRGPHKLHNTPVFETFEVTGVKGHSGILFHVGNFNADSDGCILLGKTQTRDKKHHFIGQSKVAFKEFMDLLTGINEFTLTVTKE